MKRVKVTFMLSKALCEMVIDISICSENWYVTSGGSSGAGGGASTSIGSGGLE